MIRSVGEENTPQRNISPGRYLKTAIFRVCTKSPGVNLYKIHAASQTSSVELHLVNSRISPFMLTNVKSRIPINPF
jgi:hypothetical protein